MVARGGKTGLRVNGALTVVGPLCYSPTQRLLEAAPGVTSMLEAVLVAPGGPIFTARAKCLGRPWSTRVIGLTTVWVLRRRAEVSRELLRSLRSVHC